MNCIFYKLLKKKKTHAQKKRRRIHYLYYHCQTFSPQFVSFAFNTPFNHSQSQEDLMKQDRLDFQSTPLPKELSFVQPFSTYKYIYIYLFFVYNKRWNVITDTDKIGRKRSRIEVHHFSSLNAIIPSSCREFFFFFFFFSSGPPDKRPPKLQVATLEPSLEGGGGRERGEMVEAPSKLERTVNNATLR